MPRPRATKEKKVKPSKPKLSQKGKDEANQAKTDDLNQNQVKQSDVIVTFSAIFYDNDIERSILKHCHAEPMITK